MAQRETQSCPAWSTNGLGMKFIGIPPGSFLMGYTPYSNDRGRHEFRHKVTLTKGFYLQTTPVTQRQWEAIMGGNPSFFLGSGGDAPVESVSWADIQEFLERLNRQDRTHHYRLPTEAEWEYAAKVGKKTRFFYGDDYAELGEYAWYKDNSSLRTHPVGCRGPNPWGLYDMHGNVWEWCQDWHDRYPLGCVTDPLGSDAGSGRIIRGGSWGSDTWYCNATDRFGRATDFGFYNLGFRLAGHPIAKG